MISLKHRNTCRLCGSLSIKLVLQLTPTPPGDMYLKREDADKARTLLPLDLYMCEDCGYVHLLDILDPDAIYPDYIYTTATSPGLVEHFEQYSQHVLERLKLKKDSLVVDIGSNDGALLRSFKSSGLRVVGIEPAVTIAQQATTDGIPTICGYFDELAARTIQTEYGKASLVTANNVFANIDDVEGFVENVKAILAPDGVFVIEFAYLGDLIQKKIFDYIYHEHLSYFSVETLCRFFSARDMTVVAAEAVQTKGGSIRMYVQRKVDLPRLSEGVDPWIKKEAAERLRTVETYRKLQDDVNAAAMACRAALNKLKEQGHRIVGYGASVTCTTLIYHFGLAQYLDYLVDDNETKIGRICPGLSIDVRRSSELEQRTDVVVVILAWRFAEMIVTRNQALLERGGIFIVPMPTLKVIHR